MPSRLFVPSPDSFASSPRLETADEVRDVLACVTVVDARGVATELVVGLDLGRVIRVVATAKSVTFSDRATAQLAFHTGRQPKYTIRADELYVMDVQAVERQPDAPGANDPLYLYGVLRGPYPEVLATGVAAIEGQLATTRGPLLDGLAQGIEHAFVYETGACGTRCAHAVLAADAEARSVVLAFPLVPMGDDGSNELVAGQLVHDVLGAMRTDLGDDLAANPVPVPSRRLYERELVDAGWTIDGEFAVHRGSKGRFASLFSPGKKQKLPREVTLAEYPTLIAPHVARLEGWPAARTTLHVKLGLQEPVLFEADRASTSRATPAAPPLPGLPAVPPTPPPIPPRARPPTPPPIPPRARPPTPPPIPPRARPPTPPPIPVRPRRVQRPPQGARPRTVAKGLTPEISPIQWIKKLVDEHRVPDRPPPRVTTPARSVGGTVPDWMFEPIDKDHDDDK